MKKSVQETQLKNNMVIIKVECRAQSISHLIIMTTVIILCGDGKRRKEEGKLCYQRGPKRL